LGAADGDFGLFAVVHAEQVAGFEPGHDFADVVDIDDEAAVGAPEEGGVEEFEEVFEGAALGLSVEGGCDDADDAIFNGCEADVGLVDEEEARLDLNDELAGCGRPGSGLPVEEFEEGLQVALVGEGRCSIAGVVFEGVFREADADAVEGLADAVGIEGLKEVVGGVDVKGADGVLVVGRGEDELGEPGELVMVDELLDDGEAVHAGHLDVEEDEFGAVLFDEVDGLNAVGSLGKDIDAAG